MTTYIGVDVGEQYLDAYDEGRQVERRFPNTKAGVEKLVAWLTKQHPDREMQVIVEPTSVYHQALVEVLHAQALPVTVINPRRTAAFAEGQGNRAKTDKVDARVLAQMGREKQLPPTPPPEPDREQLKYLRRQREWLQEEVERARNRRAALVRSPYVTQPVLDSLDRTIRDLEGHMKAMEEAIRGFLKDHPALREEVKLVDTVKGIGEKTAILLVSELPPASRCKDAKDWVAYSGLNPALKQSGKRWTAVLSRMGPAQVRKGLNWPAVTALRSNSVIMALGSRLDSRGKLSHQVRVAAMAKLVRQSFAVVKSGRPFDPMYQEHRKDLQLRRLQLDTQHGI